MSHPEFFYRVLILILPLVIGGILHMGIVSLDLLSYLKKPIHHRWFGQNKTWRGLVVMPLVTWPGVVLAQNIELMLDFTAPVLISFTSFQWAFILGTAYCLAELPNSFIKRRLGIKEGKTSENNKWLFVIIDQSDSAFGCLLAYKIFTHISWAEFWGTIILGTIVHLALNILLYHLKLRKNPL